MATVTDISSDTAGTDLLIVDGDFVLVEDATAVGQSVGNRLRTIETEWFLDLEYGVDYFGGPFTKSRPRPTPLDSALIEAILREEVEDVDRIQTVKQFTSARNPVTRLLTINLQADTDFGDLTDQLEI